MIASLASNPVDRVVEALAGRGCKPRPSGKNWAACCPAHEDRSPSLSIGRGDDGRALVHCHAGCSAEAIARAIGLEVADLFVEPSSRVAAAKAEPPPRTYGSWRAALRLAIREYGQPVTWHDYRRADGVLVGGVARFRTADGGKTFRQAATADGGKTWTPTGIPGPRPLLYLADVIAPKTVFVVEGEKCADAVRALGLVATTASQGAQSPEKTDWSPLVGKRVVMLPDNDAAGEKYVAIATRLLTAAGGADIRVVRVADLWQDCPEAGDVADWLADTGSHDCIRRAIEEAAEATAAPRPEDVASSETVAPEAEMHRGDAEPTTAPPCAVKAINEGNVADMAQVLARMEDVPRPTALGILRVVNSNAADPLDDRGVAAAFDAAVTKRERMARDAMSVPGILEVHDGPRPRFVPDGLELSIVAGDPATFTLECDKWRQFGSDGRAVLDAKTWCDPAKARAAIVAQLPGLSLEPTRGHWQRVWDGVPAKFDRNGKQEAPAIVGLRTILERESKEAGRWSEEMDSEKHRGRWLLQKFAEWMQQKYISKDDPEELTGLLVSMSGSKAPLFNANAEVFYFRPDCFIEYLDVRNTRTDRGELPAMWGALERIVGKLKETRRKDGGRNGPRWKVMNKGQLARLDAFLDGPSAPPPHSASEMT